MKSSILMILGVCFAMSAWASAWDADEAVNTSPSVDIQEYPEIVNRSPAIDGPATAEPVGENADLYTKGVSDFMEMKSEAVESVSAASADVD